MIELKILTPSYENSSPLSFSHAVTFKINASTIPESTTHKVKSRGEYEDKDPNTDTI